MEYKTQSEQLLRCLSFLDNRDFIKELSENKKGTRGNLLPLLNSNRRRLNNIPKLFLKYAELSLKGNVEASLKYGNGQNKYKHIYPFFKSSGFFSFDSGSGELSLTDKGCHFYKEYSTTKNTSPILEEILRDNDDYFSKFEFEKLKKNIEIIFGSKNLEQISSSLFFHKNNWELISEIVLSINFAKVSEFVGLSSVDRKVFIDKAKNIESFKFKYFSNAYILQDLFTQRKPLKYPLVMIDTLIDILWLLRNYKFVQSTELGENFVEDKPLRKGLWSTYTLRNKDEYKKVLARSLRMCEICKGYNCQFLNKSEEYFSNVHHIVPLGLLISDHQISFFDKSEYMINLCPFHHLAVHHAKEAHFFNDAVKFLEGKWSDDQKISFESYRNKIRSYLLPEDLTNVED